LEVIKVKLYDHKDRQVLTLTALLLTLFTLSGCDMAGPRSIKMGRAAYNEVISNTGDEQMLLSIVKGCYGESFSLLAVTGVAANVRFTTNAGAEFGFGPDDSFLGNLVPFRAGAAYEENPTITYAPVKGDRYLKQMLSPIPLDMLVLLIRTETHPAILITLFVSRINDMRNPGFLDSPSAKPDSRFYRFVELGTELGKAGILEWVADPKKKASYDILITNYAPAYSDKVREYLTILRLPMPTQEGEDIVLPVNFGIAGRECDGISISTRSTFDLIQILRAATEIPQEHASAGLATDYPTRGAAGKDICIHSSKNKPKRAVVAVKDRGYWFYIDDADMRTKFFFRAVETLWSTGIAAAADERAAPVLTIPVSR
jgi:hypothetical protein